VLEEVRRSDVDLIVVGGDVLPGPMPRETMARLLNLDVPVRFIHGNGELGILAQLRARRTGEAVTYWGTTSGKPLPEPLQEIVRWSAWQVEDYEQLLETWPKTVRLECDGRGDILFCHATPESETDAFTRTTPEDRLIPLFSRARAPLVVCGHTHIQFDRMIGTTRVVNAGSVGMPFGRPGADWLLLGPHVELRHTSYDLESAAEEIRRTGYPQAAECAAQLLEPPSEASILETFTNISFPGR
jgi:Icc-related predicted phosphoesterase